MFQTTNQILMVQPWNLEFSAWNSYPHLQQIHIDLLAEIT